MDTEIILLILQTVIFLATLLITIIYVILIYKTLKSSQNLNQQNIFNEVIKQERTKN